MSADEMAANGEKMSTGVARLVDDAISELHVAQRLVAELQRELMPAALHSGETAVIDKTALWHRLETIDDRIHDALAKLGD